MIFDIAGQAVQTYVETNKSAIDLAVEQSHAVVKIGQEAAAEAYLQDCRGSHSHLQDIGTAVGGSAEEGAGFCGGAEQSGL